MNIQLIKDIALKMVTEAIALAKDPTVQENAENIVISYLPQLEQTILTAFKNWKITGYIPEIFIFASGCFVGACVLLFILSNKAGLL